MAQLMTESVAAKRTLAEAEGDHIVEVLRNTRWVLGGGNGSRRAAGAMSSPVNGTVEIGGPERFRLDELIRRDLTAGKDPREVISDPHARHYGIAVSERTLVPDDSARLGEMRFEDWLIHATKQAPKAGRQSS